jgi:ribonuclease HII
VTGTRKSIAEIRTELASASSVRLARLLEEFADDGRAGVAALCAAAEARARAASAEARRTKKLYAMQRELADAGFLIVAGLDEVGRGALAGPVSAGAVVLPITPRIEGLDDSKRLTPARREELAAVIYERALAVSVAHVPASDIDALGMTAALRRAFASALEGLDVIPAHVLLDGLPMHVVEQETAVVKGDTKVAAIAAASIVAKVARDALMREVATRHPAYGFDVNKGYGTAEHVQAIVRFGPCELHRRSFSAGGGTVPLF